MNVSEIKSVGDLLNRLGESPLFYDEVCNFPMLYWLWQQEQVGKGGEGLLTRKKVKEWACEVVNKDVCSYAGVLGINLIEFRDWLQRLKEEKPTEGKTILQEASELVDGDRQRDYDHPKPNHKRIAKLWTAYLSIRRDPTGRITAEDAASMMILLKIARQVYTPKRDNLVDMAGYVRCLEMIEERRKEKQCSLEDRD